MKSYAPSSGRKTPRPDTVTLSLMIVDQADYNARPDARRHYSEIAHQTLPAQPDSSLLITDLRTSHGVVIFERRPNKN